jgi:hypothetical protein
LQGLLTKLGPSADLCFSKGKHLPCSAIRPEGPADFQNGVFAIDFRQTGRGIFCEMIAKAA